MERIMSTEDKIRRAEEIYNRRQINNGRIGTTKVNITEKRDIKLLKKIIIQIIVCLAVYSVFYLVKNNNYIFSEDFINKSKEVLNYDINFQEIYSKIIETIQTEEKTQEATNENTEGTNIKTEDAEESGIGGGKENNEQETKEPESKLTQMEQDAISINNSISFIKPIEGTITSRFGWRTPTTSTVPKYHTGIDIANVSGTKIYSATEGDVILASSKGDYGNHLKIQINDVTITYAHCKTLYAKQGEHVLQGQEIAEVGSTGNSTGPHLHFEIRKEDRLVDPEQIINI